MPKNIIKMATYKTKGIVLKRKDVGEADRLVTIFTDTQGKVTARAKGVRWPFSKNRGHLEPLSYSEFLLVEGKEIDTLASAYIIEGFKNIRDNLKKTALCYYFVELCDKMITDREKNKEVFHLLLEVLRFLDKNPLLTIVARYFEINLLSALGFRPELFFCVQCRRKLQPVTNLFSLERGGVLCPDCGRRLGVGGRRISQKTLKIMRILLEYKLETIAKLKIGDEEERLKKILEPFLVRVAERNFKSPDFFQRVQRV